MLDMFTAGKWRDALLVKIVQKVGVRTYWEDWAKDIASIASDHTTRIASLVEGSHATLHAEFERFVQGLQDNLNPSVTEHAAI